MISLLCCCCCNKNRFSGFLHMSFETGIYTSSNGIYQACDDDLWNHSNFVRSISKLKQGFSQEFYTGGDKYFGQVNFSKSYDTTLITISDLPVGTIDNMKSYTPTDIVSMLYNQHENDIQKTVNDFDINVFKYVNGVQTNVPFLVTDSYIEVLSSLDTLTFSATAPLKTGCDSNSLHVYHPATPPLSFDSTSDFMYLGGTYGFVKLIKIHFKGEILDT